MPFNGSGQFQRLRRWQDDRDAGIKIRADYADSEDDGFATGLSNCVTRDGQQVIMANLPMSGFHHSGVGDATANNQYASFQQLSDRTQLAAVATDFSTTNQVTPQSVTGLIFTLTTALTYKFEAALYITAGASGGVKLQLNGTCAVTDLTTNGMGTGFGNFLPVTALGSSIIANTAAVTRALTIIKGTITVDAGGTFGVRFCQNASNGTASTVHRGSTFQVEHATAA